MGRTVFWGNQQKFQSQETTCTQRRGNMAPFTPTAPPPLVPPTTPSLPFPSFGPQLLQRLQTKTRSFEPKKKTKGVVSLHASEECSLINWFTVRYQLVAGCGRKSKTEIKNLNISISSIVFLLPNLGETCMLSAFRCLSNNEGDGSENVTKKWIRAVSNFVALIPTPLICQMLAIFSGVEF